MHITRFDKFQHAAVDELGRTHHRVAYYRFREWR